MGRLRLHGGLLLLEGHEIGPLAHGESGLIAGADSPRRYVLDWFAAAAVVALLIVDLSIQRGASTSLYVAGNVALLLSIAFFVPPFYLLKKYGEVEQGRSYFETNCLTTSKMRLPG